MFRRSSKSTHKTRLQHSSACIKAAVTGAFTLAVSTASYGQEFDNKLFDDRLELRFLALQGFQDIQANPGAFRPGDEDQEGGFERLRANLQLRFHITENIRADVDIAEEPNDFGDNFTFNQDFGGIEFDLLGLTGFGQEDTDLTLRAGNIGASPFQFKGFQDGADNQGNALIGNSPVDFATAENGIQLSYTKSALGGIIDSYNVTGHITDSSFGEAFQDGRGYNGRLQGTLNFAGGFKVGLNFLASDQSDQLDFNAAGVASLDGVTTTNYRFGDGENYNFSASPTSSRETHIGASPGIDMSIIQLNLAYQPSRNTSAILMFGRAEDDFAFSNDAGDTLSGFVTEDAAGDRFVSNSVVDQESAVNYYVIELQQYVLSNTYLAARYTNATNETSGITDNDTLQRIQVAAGIFINPKTLWKFEFVDQDEEDNSGGQIGGGFRGFTSELSVVF